MKKLFIIVIAVTLFTACNTNEEKTENNMGNPLLESFNTPYEVPPFDLIKNEHYMPAFKEAIKQHNKQIESIVSEKEKANFENTIAAFDASGKKLLFIRNIFSNLSGANTNDEMQKMAEKIMPMLTKHKDNIFLNKNLFLRIKEVYESKKDNKYTPEQQTLVTELYNKFARGGANLDDEKQKELRKINEKLSALTLKFGDNLLAENNNFKLVIDNEKDLEGLPETSVSMAAEQAKLSGNEGKWVFTLHKPSLIPFLQYAENRDLRKKMFEAYSKMGNNNNEYDNKKIIAEIANLRIKKAKLFGYNNYAEYVLADRMAKSSDNVYKLLDKVWEPALKAAKKDARDFQNIIKKSGEKFTLQAWDWRFYAEKLRKEKYELNNEEISQYLELNNCLEGFFTVINNLWGLKMKERNDIPKYHEDVRVFEVQEANGEHVGILYMDFFVRPSKKSGAWMTDFRKECKKNDKRIAPVISTCFNFPKPAKDMPALITFENVRTLYHEFGHALHGLLANTTYYSLSGTDVKRDFVELPSQIMENWASEPEVMKMYAKNHKTGEVIPDELINKIKNAEFFDQGFAAVEYLAACYLDMNWHMVAENEDFNVVDFEKISMDKIKLMDEIIPRYKSGYFAHIFSGGYATGYYSYIWAEVLDADAFEAFKETSLFDQKTALAFRKNILEKGGTEDQGILYKRFRGAEPKIEPLLKRKGFL